MDKEPDAHVPGSGSAPTRQPNVAPGQGFTAPLAQTGATTGLGSSAAVVPPAPPGFNPSIDDHDFMRQLGLLRDLKEFIYSRAIKVDAQRDLLVFGTLNLLKPSLTGRGRAATEDEWHELDQRMQGLNALLDDAQRREFRLTRTPRFVNMMAVVFLLAAVWALAVAIFPPDFTLAPSSVIDSDSHIVVGWQLVGYLVWLLSLGGIGSIAFIGVNALAIQADATFDLANGGQVLRRILLGALFGIVLALPFGYEHFITFCTSMRDVGKGITFEVGASLLAPFVLGFSSSLVMLVLNRLVQGAETIFGIKR